MQPVLTGRRLSPGALNAVLLLATLLVFGCSSKPAPGPVDLVAESQERARATIIESVGEGARRDRALELVDELAATEHDYLKERAVLMKDLFDLNADYDAERIAFTSAYNSSQLLRRKTLEALLADLKALEQLLEPDVWNALADSMHDTQGRWSEAQ